MTADPRDEEAHAVDVLVGADFRRRPGHICQPVDTLHRHEHDVAIRVVGALADPFLRGIETRGDLFEEPCAGGELGLRRRELVRQRLKLGKISLQAAELMPCCNVRSALLLQALVKSVRARGERSQLELDGSACRRLAGKCLLALADPLLQAGGAVLSALELLRELLRLGLALLGDLLEAGHVLADDRQLVFELPGIPTTRKLLPELSDRGLERCSLGASFGELPVERFTRSAQLVDLRRERCDRILRSGVLVAKSLQLLLESRS